MIKIGYEYTCLIWKFTKSINTDLMVNGLANLHLSITTCKLYLYMAVLPVTRIQI